MEPPLPQLDGVEHHNAQVGDIRVHFAESGSGEPLVLLHGYPQHWWEWRLLIPKLAEHYRVICPDMRGFGWSDKPPSGYLKSQLAADLVGLLDALGIERARLIGHDWGGYVGFIACVENPERFSRFLALGIVHLW